MLIYAFHSFSFFYFAGPIQFKYESSVLLDLSLIFFFGFFFVIAIKYYWFVYVNINLTIHKFLQKLLNKFPIKNSKIKYNFVWSSASSVNCLQFYYQQIYLFQLFNIVSWRKLVWSQQEITIHINISIAWIYILHISSEKFDIKFTKNSIERII